MTKKRILLLIADAGYGHRSAAQAIIAALADYPDVEAEVHNPLDGEDVPAVIRKSQYQYDKFVQNMPELYQQAYEASDIPIVNSLVESVATVALYDILRRTVKAKQPDGIVIPYPYYQAPLAAYFSLSETSIPLMTVVTDLATVHRAWFNPVSDLCVVPTAIVAGLAQESGLPMDKVKTIGIPVHPDFGRTYDQAALRQRLGWATDKTVILAVGSDRVSNIPRMLQPVNHANLDVEMALVAGGNDELYAEFQQTEWHQPTHIYNFVENMPQLMAAADCIVCKAGGLIVTEALAAGLPLLLVDVIEGQETGNAAFVIDANAGAHVTEPTELLETVYHWIQDGQLPTKQSYARQAGQPHAAKEIAKLAYELVSQNQPSSDAVKQLDNNSILDLFARFGVDTEASR
ncbi:MAG: glycosyltransferase [Chloroflexi bacterium]|nr:glycosyltransferase [Chloroflexota bacterium]